LKFSAARTNRIQFDESVTAITTLFEEMSALAKHVLKANQQFLTPK
jgi:hypothetical protein